MRSPLLSEPFLAPSYCFYILKKNAVKILRTILTHKTSDLSQIQALTTILDPWPVNFLPPTATAWS